MNTVDDYDNQNDSGMVPDDSGVAEDQTADYEMEENTEDGVSAGPLPNLHISEDDDMDEMGKDILRFNIKAFYFITIAYAIYCRFFMAIKMVISR